jgi:hypothetical protein
MDELGGSQMHVYKLVLKENTANIPYHIQGQHEMVQGQCAHLGFKCWDMGIVAWVTSMTNVVLDDG